MADPSKFRLSARPRRPICALHNNSLRLGRPTVTAMLSFIVYFARRKRRFAWSPAVDLSDPYVAAALAPMTHS